jgi:hypothetical protein
MRKNVGSGLSLAFKFCMYSVYMSILVRSSGAAKVFVTKAEDPYTRSCPYTFFSLGFVSPRPFLFRLSCTRLWAMEEMLMKAACWKFSSQFLAVLLELSVEEEEDFKTIDLIILLIEEFRNLKVFINIIFNILINRKKDEWQQ